MRPLALLVSLFASACVTGLPVGARARGLDETFRRFNPPAPWRAVPREQPVSASRPAARPLPASGDDARKTVVELAQGLVGQTAIKVGGRLYPNDCTGLITAAYSKLGLSLLSAARPGDNAVTAIFRFAQRNGRVFDQAAPEPGDLVFFRETYDQNRDGRVNDGLTHIGIVETVDEHATVTVIHRVSRGVVRYRMNLSNPSVRVDPKTGRAINDYLRAPGSGRKKVLTGQLFAAYASLVDEPVQVAARDPAHSVARPTSRASGTSTEPQARAVRSHAAR